jgi:iron complex outermembrane recepter protein
MSRIFLGSAFLTLAALSVFVIPRGASSQESPQISQVLEEIVVTARFREESIQKIGGSVTALGAEQIEASGITDFEDIVARIPGLNERDGGPNQNDIAIRGISRAQDPIIAGLNGSSPLVTIYLDDIAISTPSARDRDINLFDLSRVEVIRGPQPTFFGEGAVGGVVRYFSSDPTLEAGVRMTRVGATLSATDSGGANYLLEAGADLTLVPEKAGIRASAFWREDDGYIDNVVLGVNNVNGYDTAGGRISALLKPTDRLSIQAFAHFANDTVQDPFFVDGGNPDPHRLTKSAPLDSRVDDEFTLVGAKLGYQGERWTLFSVTGLYDRTMDSFIWDPTQGVLFDLLPLFGFPVPPGDFATPIAQKIKDHNFTQELRFVSTFDSPVNVTAGLFYKDADYRQEGGAFTFPSMTLVFPLGVEQNRKQYAGFAELSWRATESLRVIGGARYVDEKLKVTVDDFTVGLINAVLPEVTGDDFQFHLKKWLPRVALEWQARENVLVYTSFAEGVRNGGLNGPLAAAGAVAPGDTEGFRSFLFFGEDSVDAYEIGVKTTWPGHRLTFNAAAFLNRYSDPQTLFAFPFGGTTAGPDARSSGVELELWYKPSDFVTLSGGFAYTDAKFTGSDPALSIEKGNKLSNIPKIAFSVGADAVHPTRWAGVQLLAGLDFEFTGERYTSQVRGPNRKAGSLERLNGRLGLQYGNWKLTAFVSNILNDIEATDHFQNGIDSFGALPAIASGINRPRTTGLRLSGEF